MKSLSNYIKESADLDKIDKSILSDLESISKNATVLKKWPGQRFYDETADGFKFPNDKRLENKFDILVKAGYLRFDTANGVKLYEFTDKGLEVLDAYC